jgi:acid phosphatase (class A)
VRLMFFGIIGLPAMAAETAVPAKFVDARAIDVAGILPRPPETDSVAGLADLEVVLQVQASRTPEQVEWAKLVERDRVYYNASIVGDWFAAENVPLAAAFFKDLGDDLRAIDMEAKKPFLRPRPPKADPRVQPCVQVGNSTGYPSGSAIQAFVWAELLSEVFPEKRAALIERAHRAAWGRLVGGVHYPSDIVAGRLLAAPFLAECRKSEAFGARWEAAKAEMRHTAQKKP